MSKIISYPTLRKLSQDKFDANMTIVLLLLNPETFGSWHVTQMIAYGTDIFTQLSTALGLHVKGAYFEGWVVLSKFNGRYSYHLLNPDESIKSELHKIHHSELAEHLDCSIDKIENYI